MKCVLITTAIAKKAKKPEIRGKAVALYSNLDAAKLDLMINGINSVQIVKFSNDPRYVLII